MTATGEGGLARRPITSESTDRRQELGRPLTMNEDFLDADGMAARSSVRDGNGEARRDLGSTTVVRPGGVPLVLVLNLDRQPARWQRLCDHLSQVHSGEGGTLRDAAERVPAVDGMSIPLDQFSRDISRSYTLEDFFAVDPQSALRGLRNRNQITISVSAQEMAVAQSHLSIWRRVANGDECVLVLEDDADFAPSFGKRFDDAWADLAAVAPDGFDVLYLSFRPVDSGFRFDPCSSLTVRPRSGIWWMSGYVLSPRGAQRLLDALPIVGPVDQWMNHQFERLEVFATKEPLIGQTRLGQSDNQYSVVPILRTAKDARSAPMQTTQKVSPSASGSGRRLPVFGIGLRKTGTTSLHEALTVLGYRSCHWLGDDFSQQVSEAIDNGRDLPFEAFTDVASVLSRFRELDTLYPDAAFVLTTRDVEDWLRSQARHVALNQADVLNGRTEHSWTSIDLDAWRSERLLHHEAVFSHFQSRPDKLLVLDICGGDGWEPLCEFLGCPVPTRQFPRVDPLASRVRLEASVVPQRSLRISEARELPHDDFPWIERQSLRPSPPSSATSGAVAGSAAGEFRPIIDDDMSRLDNERWTQLSDTFETNMAQFQPANVTTTPTSGARLEVRSQRCLDRNFTAGGLAIPDDPSRWLRYGRFEAEIRPAAADGLLTGLFLYRRDPWQEIDLEFLGRDPTKLLANVYFNPGIAGDKYNYGSRGTPVLVDLGFDASADHHRYAIEWDPSGIRWLVDDLVVYARAQRPTPVPDLPLRPFVTTWPINAPDLAGTIARADLPASTYVRSMRIAAWVPQIG